MDPTKYTQLVRETVAKALGPEWMSMEVTFSGRPMKSLGVATSVCGYISRYATAPKVSDYKVVLSSRFYAAISEEQRIDTCLHEAAHIVCEYRHYMAAVKAANDSGCCSVYKSKRHGPEWKAVAIEVGAIPQACAEAGTVDYTKVPGYYAWQVGCCGKIFHLPSRKHAKFIVECAFTPRVCNHCKNPQAVRYIGPSNQLAETRTVSVEQSAEVAVEKPAVEVPKHTCPKCKIAKEYSAFGERKMKQKDGSVKVARQSYCRECR